MRIRTGPRRSGKTHDLWKYAVSLGSRAVFVTMRPRDFEEKAKFLPPDSRPAIVGFNELDRRYQLKRLMGLDGGVTVIVDDLDILLRTVLGHAVALASCTGECGPSPAQEIHVDTSLRLPTRPTLDAPVPGHLPDTRSPADQ